MSTTNRAMMWHINDLSTELLKNKLPVWSSKLGSPELWLLGITIGGRQCLEGTPEGRLLGGWTCLFLMCSICKSPADCPPMGRPTFQHGDHPPRRGSEKQHPSLVLDTRFGPHFLVPVMSPAASNCRSERPGQAGWWAGTQAWTILL